MIKLSELMEERNSVDKQEAIAKIKADVSYDTEEYDSPEKIINTLIEIQLLKEFLQDPSLFSSPMMLAFWYERFKSLYSRTATEGQQKKKWEFS
jgi:hypothetical protein